MYIGSAGPGPGGRTGKLTAADGKRTADGRTDGGQTDGRIDGRADGRTDGGRADGRGRTDGRKADGHRMRKAEDPNLQSVDKPLARDIFCQSRSAHGGRSEVLCIEVWPTPARVDGRTGGRRVPPAGRTEGRTDFEQQCNDFHRFSQKKQKNMMFFCRFASGGGAITDFYSSNEKGVQKMQNAN